MLIFVYSSSRKQQPLEVIILQSNISQSRTSARPPPPSNSNSLGTIQLTRQEIVAISPKGGFSAVCRYWALRDVSWTGLLEGGANIVGAAVGEWVYKAASVTWRQIGSNYIQTGRTSCLTIDWRRSWGTLVWTVSNTFMNYFNIISSTSNKI